MTSYTDDRYYTQLAAAFARGHLGCAEQDPAEAMRLGAEAGLRVHAFKRSSLPRVQRVLGALRGLAPENLLDVGSGRGAFLWPLLDAFPELAVTALDIDERCVADIDATRQGGVERLTAAHGDASRRPEWPDGSFDVVTVLEVLEHLDDPAPTAAELLRLARRFVVASVPSKPDDNPQHLRVFTPDALTELFLAAGAARVSVDHVLNHMIAVARKPS